VCCGKENTTPAPEARNLARGAVRLARIGESRLCVCRLKCTASSRGVVKPLASLLAAHGYFPAVSRADRAPVAVGFRQPAPALRTAELDDAAHPRVGRFRVIGGGMDKDAILPGSGLEGLASLMWKTSLTSPPSSE
jgi:hypothetical protein